MTIAIVDDHDLVREGLNAILATQGVYNVEKFASANMLLDRVCSGKEFDFYVVDLELPDMDGFKLIQRLRGLNPQAAVIVSTIHDEIWTLRKLIAQNVNAIIYKSADCREILTAIDVIREGSLYYCEEAIKALNEATDNSLHPSGRELEVLERIACGKTSREIAEELFITDNTVEAHRKALLSKLGAANVAELIYKAIEKGYIMR